MRARMSECRCTHNIFVCNKTSFVSILNVVPTGTMRALYYHELMIYATIQSRVQSERISASLSLLYTVFIYLFEKHIYLLITYLRTCKLRDLFGHVSIEAQYTRTPIQCTQIIFLWSLLAQKIVHIEDSCLV